MAKPAIFCKLQKGKILDTHTGFVATWNYLIDVLKALHANGQIKVKDGASVTVEVYYK